MDIKTKMEEIKLERMDGFIAPLKHELLHPISDMQDENDR